MAKLFKKILFAIVFFILLCGVIFLSYIAYIDINCSAAKQYLIDKYGFNKKSIHSKKYTEYVYEDITDCSTLWFKKCTDNKDLVFSYTFILSDKTEIIVMQDTKGNYSDNYKKEDNNTETDMNTEQSKENVLETEKNE